MGLNCGCPAETSLPYVAIEACSESIGQVQKLMFQRIYASAGVKNTITSPTAKASWTAKLTAADSTKVVVSPYIQNPVVEPGGARKFGGGNATVGGIEILVGREPSMFTAAFHNVKQSTTIKALKTLECEETGVFLIDEYGRIIGTNTGTASVPVLSPIPIYNFFVGDKKLGGLEEPDTNAIEWTFAANWSDNLYVVEPADFNPLSELVNVAPTTTTTTA